MQGHTSSIQHYFSIWKSWLNSLFRSFKSSQRCVSITFFFYQLEMTDQQLKKDHSVTQVYVIFQLLPEYGHFDISLAYVKWYTSLQSYVPSLWMYQVIHLYQNWFQCTFIIPLNQIVWSCHLILKFGIKIGYTWKTENILNSANMFYLNLDLWIYNFVLFRYMDLPSSQT